MSEPLSLIVLFIGGVFGGFFGSMVGSAGLVSLPLLILIGQTPHQAVATSRPAACVLELVSALRYRREGTLNRLLLQRGSLLGLAGAAGGMIGSFLIAGVSDQTLRLLFAVVMSLMFVLILVKKDWGGVECKERQRHYLVLAVCTLLTGIYSGFFGFTFGTLITFILAAFGYTLLQSVVMSRVIGVFTTFASMVAFLLYGTIRWDYASALGVGFAIGAWVGAGVGAKRGHSFIKFLLSLVVIASVAKLLFDYLSAQ